MELLLNLVWLSLALAAFLLLACSRRASGQIPQVPYARAILTMACVVVLLFPIVSASDDLHPTQAVLEEATKRLQRAALPLLAQNGSVAPLLLALFVLCLLFALVFLQFQLPLEVSARVLVRERVPRQGRSPPLSLFSF